MEKVETLDFDEKPKKKKKLKKVGKNIIKYYNYSNCSTSYYYGYIKLFIICTIF